MYDWLERAARTDPGRVALDVAGERAVTYAELLQSARTQARALSSAGIEPGMPLQLDKQGLDFATSLHAALLHGAVAVPVDARLSDEERALRTVSEPPATPATATVMFTSGTTSAPKQVHLTLANWEANAIGSALALGLDRNERWLCVLPFAHVAGLSILLRSTLYGTTVVLRPRFETEPVLAELMDPVRAITLVSLVPTMLARLLDAGLHDPPTLRWVLLGGGPIPPGLLARAQAAGVPVAWTYGMTEGCSQIATFGIPLHGVELRLNEGEIVVRGPNFAPNSLDREGWLYTGDLGEFEEGRLRIIGRSADTIVSGGENIAPAEVEAMLLEHPAVADAGVFARSDAEWGEQVVATVVLREGLAVSAAELQEFVASRLARFKVPKEIDFSDELPRTVSGKLLRRRLG
jgi:o-succinylbenzoate---CoA ligase